MILASQSPRRVELMRDAGYTFRAVPADIDETPLPGEQPRALVERLARSKAIAVAERVAEEREIVLAADTTVAVGGQIMGKPENDEEARRMLARLSGRTHEVATGVAVALGALEPHIAESFTVVSEVTFYPLDSSEIMTYVATGEPLDKAGGYGIQGLGGRMLVERINGDFYNVMGLPIAAVARRLERFCDAHELSVDLIRPIRPA